MKLKISVNKCKYCGSNVILIDDYGSCPNNCPGHMKEVFVQECSVPDSVISTISLEARKWSDKELVVNHPRVQKIINFARFDIEYLMAYRGYPEQGKLKQLLDNMVDEILTKKEGG